VLVALPSEGAFEPKLRIVATALGATRLETVPSGRVEPFATVPTVEPAVPVAEPVNALVTFVTNGGIELAAVVGAT
jgi:hypothetical protein